MYRFMNRNNKLPYIYKQYQLCPCIVICYEVKVERVLL